MASSERFGYEWDKYNEIEDVYEKQFRNWIFPLDETSFKDKEFMDVGCGMGRNSYWALRWGAKSCLALDLDDRSLNRTKSNLKDYANTRIIKLSAYDIEWKNRFDIVFSIGVIHHLSDPKKALMKMRDSLKVGGTMIVWVYSQEGNEWIKRYIDPLRIHIFSKLPLWLVHFLSGIFTVPLFIFARFNISNNKYLNQLSVFSFRHIRSIVFDQLIPSIANYWSYDEIIELFSDLNLKDIDIHMPPNRQGWTIIGTKQ
jgi:SAM-dependent methyltransferase